MSVQFGGAATSGVETRVRIRRRLNEIGDARLTLIGAPADLTIPANGDTVEITDVQLSRVLFGGNVRTPTVEIIDGGELLEVTVPCVGHEQRLQDTIISPEDGIRIVQLATAAEQVQEIVKLLEGEGFTTGTLPDLGDGQTTDMRFKPAYAVLRAIAEAASAVLVVSPGKEVTAPLLTALPSAGVTLDGNNTTDPRRSVDPKDRRTQQYLIGGALERTLAFVGDGVAKAFDLTGTEDPTDVEIEMPTPATGATGFPAIQRVGWLFQSSVSYGDLSALAATPGNSVLLRQLTIGNPSAGPSTTEGSRRISLLTSTTAAETAQNREDLSGGWEESPRAITASAPGLADCVIPGPAADGVEADDLGEPYHWTISQAQADAAYADGGLEQWKLDVAALSAADLADLVATFSDGTTAAERISLSVTAVSRVTVSNVEVEVDSDGAEWRFGLPSQQLIQASGATALTTSQTLRSGFRPTEWPWMRWTKTPRSAGCCGRATCWIRTSSWRAFTAEREAHAEPAERIRGGIAIRAKLHVDVGQTVAVDTALAGLLQVDTPAASDTWVLSVVSIQTVGDLLKYGFSTQRDRYETESLDYWRELRAAPAD